MPVRCAQPRGDDRRTRAPPSTSCISRESCPHEASSRFAGSAAVGSSRRLTTRAPLLRHPLPQRRRRMQHEDMHVPPDRQRPQHVEMARGQPRQPEERQPRRQIDEPRLLPQPRTRTLNPLGRIRNPDPLAQPPPKLRLPEHRRAGTAPSPSSPRAQARTISGRCSAYRSNSSARCRTVLNRRARRAGSASSPAATEMRGQALPATAPPDTHQPPRAEPKPPAPATTDPHPPRSQTPSQPHPRRASAATGSRRSRTPHRPAHPRPEPIRHPLREPPLHAARRHGNDLRRERVGQRVGQERAKRLDQAVGPLSSMDVEHVGESAWRAAWIEPRQ